MPSSRTFEEDAVPLTDLLRTGEASRLRRRGAMRSGHRREDSDEPVMPPSRHVRSDPVGPGQRSGRRRDGLLCFELTCGVPTTHFSAEPSSSNPPSYLPQARCPVPPSELGFVYSSTGCGTVIISAALLIEQRRNSTQQLYFSTDTSNKEVVRLPDKYLDHEQRVLGELLSVEHFSCKCEWGAIGCRVCGNFLGFLFIPSRPSHARDNKNDAPPTQIYVSSSVTPSSSCSVSAIDAALSDNPLHLLHVAASSESEDISMDSPTFSPRPQVVPEIGDGLQPRPQDRIFDFFDFSQILPSPQVDARGSGNMQTPVAFPTMPEGGSANHPREEVGIERNSSNSPWPRTDGPRSETQGQPSNRRMSAPHEHAGMSGSNSNDTWNTFIAPLAVRRLLDERSDGRQYPWVPRELRERPPGALAPGERAVDRPATMMYPDSPERGGVPQSVAGAASPVRASDPPTLHRVPRRHLNTISPPIRRPVSFDASSWRPRTVTPSGPSRQPYIPERLERGGDSERGLRMSRWATVSGVNTYTRRRGAVSNHTIASAPAFILLDSTEEPSYPPSVQSSLDDRDTLSVDSDQDGSRASGWRYNYSHAPRQGYRSVEQVWGELHDARDSLVTSLRAEEPEAEDEEKVEDEQHIPEPLERRSPFVPRGRELVLDEQSVSSVSQLPLG